MYELPGDGGMAKPAPSASESDKHYPPDNDAEGRASRATLQTELAVDRTILAVERSYDAWVRTGLTALAAGIGARALLTAIVPDFLTRMTGAVLVLFAAFCFGVAAWREISFGGRLTGLKLPHLPRTMILAVNGFLMAVAIAAFIGLMAAN